MDSSNTYHSAAILATSVETDHTQKPVVTPSKGPCSESTTTKIAKAIEFATAEGAVGEVVVSTIVLQQLVIRLVVLELVAIGVEI
jgi:hypothetical protein